jgi:hypothetical protein
MNESTITLLANYYNDLFAKEKLAHLNCSCWNVKLPIKTIDGIKVNVQLIYKGKKIYNNLAYKKEDEPLVERLGNADNVTLDIESDKYLYLGEPLTYYNTEFYNKKKVFVGNDLTDLEFTLDDWIAIVPLMNDIFKKLQFNKLTGKFTTYEVCSNEIQEALMSLICSENITPTMEKCGVCFDITHCKTRCNHSVCYHCLEHINIKDPSGDDDENYIIECPICRGDTIELDSNY